VALRPANEAAQAVLFDLDGVLVDSFRVWLAVVNAARKRFGHPVLAAGDLKPIFGQGVSDDMRNLYPGRSRAEILGAYDDAMPASIREMEVNPEAVPVLRALGARGIRRAVVTNTQQSLARLALTTVGFLPHLDAWTGVTAGLREKPAPDLLLHVLERLRLPPGRALMVGDTDYDARAAAAAGVPFLRYEIRTGARLAEALAGALGVSLAVD
jgi:HAD superfamily hydrolase (TIGR01509 family)